MRYALCGGSVVCCAYVVCAMCIDRVTCVVGSVFDFLCVGFYACCVSGVWHFLFVCA